MKYKHFSRMKNSRSIIIKSTVQVQLTFDIDFNVGGFAEPECVLGHALVGSGRVPGDRADDDVAVRVENSVDSLFLPPKNNIIHCHLDGYCSVGSRGKV